MSEERISEARERVLRVAEQLFMERGYMAVSLRDIAVELGMQKASLYNHAPGGKEALFITVVERSLARHAAGIQQAISAAPHSLKAQLKAVAGWLFSQPPLHLQRMQVSDLPAIQPVHAERLMQRIFETLLAPIERCVHQAAARGEVRQAYAGMLAGTFLAALESLRELDRRSGVSKEVLVDQLIALLLDGAYAR